MVIKVVIDEELVKEARIVGKHATNKAVVNEALVEYIQRRKQAEIIELFHTVEYARYFDYKIQRKKQ